MQMQIFTIRDSKAEVFNQPFYAHTPGEAERNLRTLVNDPKTQISQYATDYDLYALGHFDTKTGKLTTQEPKHLVHAAQLKDQ